MKNQWHLRVLDLASEGRASKAYSCFSPKKVLVHSISNRESSHSSRSILRASNVISIHKISSFFEDCSWGQNSFEHIHFHMLDGARMNFSEFESIVKRIDSYLVSSGIFFFSFDHYFFDLSSIPRGAGIYDETKKFLSSLLNVQYLHFSTNCIPNDLLWLYSNSNSHMTKFTGDKSSKIFSDFLLSQGDTKGLLRLFSDFENFINPASNGFFRNYAKNEHPNLIICTKK